MNVNVMLIMKTNLLFKTLLFVACIICWTSCQQKENQFQVTVTGLEGYDGEIAYLFKELYVHMDSTSILLDSAVIANGTLQFAGKADSLYFYSIRPKRAERLTQFGKFCPEAGELHLKADTTPHNAHFEFVSSSSPCSINEVYMEKRFTSQYSSPQKLYCLMGNNLQNVVGGALFASTDIPYNDIDSIYQKTNKKLIAGNYWLQLLEKLVHTTASIHIGDSFIDFKQKEYQGDSLQFSDIAGKGKYTCLAFVQNQNDLTKLKEQLRTWNREFPNVQHVYNLTFPEVKDSSEYVFSKLIESTQGVILQDNPQDDRLSVKWIYRVFLKKNNMAFLFDSNGILKEIFEAREE